MACDFWRDRPTEGAHALPRLNDTAVPMDSSVIRYEACKKHPEGRERPPINHTPYHVNVHNPKTKTQKPQGAKKETVTLKVLRPLTICLN